MEVMETPDPAIRRVEILVEASRSKNAPIAQLTGFLAQTQAAATQPVPP
jgi:hypothetical protein